MQVALPRSQDAGKLQDQMLKQNQHFQEALAQNHIKQEELKRKKVQQSDDTEEVRNQKEEEHGNTDSQDSNNKKKDGNENKLDHPYLGTKFDFSG